MSEIDVSKAAKELSKLGASKGGIARAQKMTAEERKDVAQKAADARWGIPEALFEGELHIGDLVIPCAVLEDKRRVLSETGMLNSLGLYRSGAMRSGPSDDFSSADLPLFLSQKNLRPFIDSDLEAVLLNPIWYKPIRGGSRHKGVDAQLIPRICDVWLRARDAGVLGKRQAIVAAKADIIMRGLATVGIVALVDEATGYEKLRDRYELNKILEAYIAKELLPWAQRFPDEYYKQIFRLRGWAFSPLNPTRGPRFAAQITNKIVYEQLPPGVFEELKNKNPVVYKRGRRKHKLFQFLTDDIGNPHLEKQVTSVTTLMRAAPNWKVFEMLFRRAFPGPTTENENQQIDMFVEDNEEREYWKALEEPEE